VTTFTERLANVVHGLGLGPWGVVAQGRYDAAAPEPLRTAAILPGARSVVVIGSGGPALFRRFVDDVGRSPSRLDEPDPLDSFVERTFAHVDALFAEGGERFRRIPAAATATPRLDFVRLAMLAGLGLPGEFGLLVHPVFGPWFALRAAVFTTRDLPDSAPMSRSLCEGCPAPCRAACPPRIVGPGPFDWRACAAAHDAGEPCRSRCGARLACVIGPQSRYDPMQILYHADRARGVAAIREASGSG